MDGLLLSLGWSAVAVAVTAVLFHARPAARQFLTACRVHAAGLVGLVVTEFLWPPSGPESAVTILLSFYFYAFWFFGVFAQLYFLADRGFSLTILTDGQSGPEGGRTREEMKQAYAGGQGMAYVRAKRLRQMVEMGWFRPDGRRYRLTTRGHRIGQVCVRLHRLYRFREVG